MRLMLKYLLVGLVLTIIAGCAQTEQMIGGYVQGYCLQPQDKRALIRANIDTVTEPHKVRVLCAGDTPEQRANENIE